MLSTWSESCKSCITRVTGAAFVVCAKFAVFEQDGSEQCSITAVSSNPSTVFKKIHFVAGYACSKSVVILANCISNTVNCGRAELIGR